MKIHKKKLEQPFFDQVWNGTKTFELRRNDCDYQVGDTLILNEWQENLVIHFEDGREVKGYTGRFIIAEIIYKLEGYIGLEDGYCILGIRIMERDE